MRLIEKYNISEKDLYILSSLEQAKSDAKFFKKEKIKGKALALLKPYKVGFMDISDLMKEIKELNYYTDSVLVEKYGKIDIENLSFDSGLSSFKNKSQTGEELKENLKLNIDEINQQRKKIKWSKAVAAIIVIVLPIGIYFGMKEDKQLGCGCSMSVSIPSYVDNFEDKKSNYSHLDCAVAESDKSAEKIHIEVFYNKKLDIYRCELRYTTPQRECSKISKNFGANAIVTADISEKVYNSGEWKQYDYWFRRNLF